MFDRFGYRCLHWFFICFNVLFWILGCGCLGIGIWLYLAKTDYLTLAPAAYGALSAAGLCIAAGATVIVIGFVGCCGAWIESRCLLLTYFVFVLLVFVIEATAGTLGVMHQHEVNQVIHLEMRNNLHNPYLLLDDRAADGSVVRLTWHHVQSQFKCCGVDSYNDWYRSASWPKQDWVPDSCCNPDMFLTPEDYPAEESSNGTVGNTTTSAPLDSMHDCGKLHLPDHYYQEGCYEAFSAWLLEHLRVVGVMGIIFAFVQLFGLAAALLLFCRLGKRPYRMASTRDRDELMMA